MNHSEKWTALAWSRSSEIFGEIIKHPFIQQLADGSLETSRFERYIAQDEAYLGNYGRQMFQFAELIEDPAQHEMFVEFARSGIEGEKTMHELLISRFGIDTKVTPSVVTKAYNEHTEAGIASGSKAIALAALLPCMWVYNEVGLEILKIARMDCNPYREWILEYGNEEFTQGVRTVLDLVDSYAEEVDETTREAMTKSFVEGTLYEYAFWDYGYYGDEKSYENYSLGFACRMDS